MRFDVDIHFDPCRHEGVELDARRSQSMHPPLPLVEFWRSGEIDVVELAVRHDVRAGEPERLEQPKVAWPPYARSAYNEAPLRENLSRAESCSMEHSNSGDGKSPMRSHQLLRIQDADVCIVHLDCCGASGGAAGGSCT